MPASAPRTRGRCTRRTYKKTAAGRTANIGTHKLQSQCCSSVDHPAKNFNGCERKDIHSKYSDFLKDKLNSDRASAIRSMRDQESIEQQGHNIRVAKSFVQAAPLAQWVRQQNVDKGLAPPSRHIIQQMESSDRMACIAADSGSPLPVMPPLASVVTGLDLEPLISKRCNKRVQRWRRKWNVRLSKIRGGETPSMSEITKKVPRRPPKSKNSGPQFGGQKRTPLLCEQ